MLSRVSFFAVHCVAHVCLYLVPRCLFYILVKLPITLIEQQLGEQRSFPENDFLMEVVTNWWDKSTLRFFGIVERGMEYPRPLYGGHMQTLMGAMLRRVPKATYRRVVVTADDSNPICLDWSLAKVAEGQQARGVLLVLPGLGSSSASSYIHHFAVDANREGFHCCVMNTRGMGDTPVTAPRLMSAVFTADVRAILRNGLLLTAAVDAGVLESSELPLQAVGFSLGGVILTNYLYEESIKQRNDASSGLRIVKAGLHRMLSVGHAESSIYLTRPAQMMLYQRALTRGLREYVFRHRKVVEQMPEIPSNLLAAGGRMERVSTVQEFDSLFIVPHFGFKCREDYYTAATVTDGKLEHVAIPMMCIGAQDDPIVGPPPHLRRWERIAQTNKNIVFVGLPAGGHLGFLGNPLDELSGATQASHLLLLHAARNVVSEN
ncbi:transmembrane protein, putative [Bodo saltans]|uniref:Transmembrane protein, putative n=1 Tax=Bodo saltans TaxID=75058 RepID=A0A0S4JMS7_BODSA|nr:transmembrane protein, putative [Bodo saltans]|eukprot:CUG92827.1 transmembrane protein, putative [Bodo saltans]